MGPPSFCRQLFVLQLVGPLWRCAVQKGRTRVQKNPTNAKGRISRWTSTKVNPANFLFLGWQGNDCTTVPLTHTCFLLGWLVKFRNEEVVQHEPQWLVRERISEYAGQRQRRACEQETAHDTVDYHLWMQTHGGRIYLFKKQVKRCSLVNYWC